MSTIGPSLPAHLQSKRKYDDINRDERSSPISEDGDKRRRTIGPALPPAPLDERPTEPTVSEDSDSDGYGPAPALGVDDESSQNSLLEEQAHEEDAPSKPQRAEWMLAPPPGDDWTARVDPTRLRSRRFNTSKTAMPAPQAASESTLWTETPEQKKKRLRNEVLGIADPSQDPPKQAKRHDPANEKTKKRTMENSEPNRAASLYKQHQKRRDIEEDDPTQRAFDREKDIGGGTMSGSKRKDLMNRVADFGTRFSKGSYL